MGELGALLSSARVASGLGVVICVGNVTASSCGVVVSVDVMSKVGKGKPP